MGTFESHLFVLNARRKLSLQPNIISSSKQISQSERITVAMQAGYDICVGWVARPGIYLA
jgi:hypothetical protein